MSGCGTTCRDYLLPRKRDVISKANPSRSIVIAFEWSRRTALPTLGDNYSEFDHIDVSANPELSAMPEAYSGKYPRLRITWPTAWGGC